MSEILDLLDAVGVLSPAEAARYLGIGKTKLYGELNSGRLKAKRAGGQTLIERTELDRWIAALPDHKPAETPRSAMMRAIRGQHSMRRHGHGR
jgi:excisionase family DNA binding protein